ncbi:MAG TPA: phosphatase PAP2 family protein [Bdellovibrionales bacterium]|nr:phosphatase PAP2 family protein [Bdellovibrionales bacterium]
MPIDLLAMDYEVLRFFNATWSGPYWEMFWRTFTDLHKIPLVRFGLIPMIILWLAYLYRWQVLKPLISMTAAIAIADNICYRVLKKGFERARPLDNPEIADWLQRIGHAAGHSFPSNHAANVFAGATIMAWYWPRQAKYFYIFAALVAISRPVLGVHYPSDVIAGSLLGIIVARLIRGFVLSQHSYFHLRKRVSNSDASISDSRPNHRRWH